MSSSRWLIAITVVSAALSVAAERTLAVRVEVAPLRAQTDGTAMAVAVTVAPEDRSALGEDVMVWVELDRRGERVFRRGWALKVEDPARPLTVEAVLPPGAGSLRVELEAAGGRGQAVWWGDVVVPDLTGVEAGPAAGEPDAEAVVPEPEAPPSPAVDPVPPPVLPTVVASPPLATGPAATPSRVRAASPPAAAPQAAPPAAEPQVVEGPAEPSSATQPQPEPEPPLATPAAREREVVDEPEAPAAPAPAATPRPQPLPTPVPELELEPAPASVPPAPAAAALATVPLAPVYLEWPTGAAGDGELTVAVVRAGRPVAGLGSGDLEVRAGREVPVLAVGGPDRAPLLLAVAVGMGPGSASDAPWVGRMVGELTTRAAGGRGRVLVRTAAGADSGWGVDPAVVPELVAVAELPAEHDLPGLVRSSLDRFRGLRGRAFLLVVTDGGGAGSGDGWKDAFEAADLAGVPVLVAGLWNGDFGRGLRKDLRRLGELSGGAVFYLQGAVQADDLLERFGPVIDGSAAVRVDLPPGTTGVEVRAPGLDGAEVRASTTVR